MRATVTELLQALLQLAALEVPRRAAIDIPAGSAEEPLIAPNHEVVGALLHRWQALEGTVEVSAVALQRGAFPIDGADHQHYTVERPGPQHHPQANIRLDSCHVHSAGRGMHLSDRSSGSAAAAAGVLITTGDTKVVQRGKADGCFINTAGVGVLERSVSLGAANVQPGDAVLVSGPIGDHGITIMLARGELDIISDIASDTAPLTDLVTCLLNATPAVHCLRDATRGGVATILNEVAMAANVAVVVDERAIPVRAEVRGVCELLEIDPLYVACEGRLVAIVSGPAADTALQALRSHPLGQDTAILGTLKDDPPGLVLLKTQFGGTRIMDMLVGDPPPRIC
jgi:hypothetical protein